MHIVVVNVPRLLEGILELLIKFTGILKKIN